jgi:starch synthase
VPFLREADAQLAVIGSGEPELERRFTALAAAHPGQVGCMIGYDEQLAHLMQAGADALVVPSRFEPCGLTQMCALRYGAVPVVARVGGLADTVVDAEEGDGATGILFSPVMRDALEGAIGRAARLWSARPDWRRLQANGMATDVSWGRSAKTYAALYADVLARTP